MHVFLLIGLADRWSFCQTGLHLRRRQTSEDSVRVSMTDSLETNQVGATPYNVIPPVLTYIPRLPAKHDIIMSRIAAGKRK